MALGIFLAAGFAMAQEELILPPDDPRIVYSDYVHIQQAADPASVTGKTACFDRILDMPGRGYRWDNPGARIRFRTNATSLEVFLRYTAHHTSTTARNPVGRYWIDGRSETGWIFRTQSASIKREAETVRLSLTSPAPGAFHDYEIVMPYGDSVEFQGLRCPPDTHFETPAPRPSIRLVSYGDSITQGFTSSEQARSYTFLLAQKKNWELLNMGFGGRASTIADGAVVGSLSPNVVTVLIGVNDWQGGVAVETYRSHMDGFLAGLRSACPQVPIYLITPLWVNPSWKPEKAAADLEDYRKVLRDLVAARSDSNLHLVEGPSLIDPDPALFSAVPVHPNDQGFEQMAERLSALVSEKSAP